MTRGLIDPEHVSAMSTDDGPAKRSPGRRDVARQVVVLASDSSRAVTGQVVVVAGGMEGRTLRDD